MSSRRVHVVIRATVDLDDDVMDDLITYDGDDLRESLEDAAVRGLGSGQGVYEVLSCAVLDVIEAVDTSWGEGP